MSGMCVESLKHYKELLKQLESEPPELQSVRNVRAKAVLLYKMSQVHRQQRDYQSELAKLQTALRSAVSLAQDSRKALEETIMDAIKRAEEELSKAQYEWI